MRIIRNYILRETIAPFIISLSVLTGVMLMGNLIRLADLIINKGINIFLVMKLFAYLMPFILSYTLPIACLSSVLLTFSRFSSDNEIIAIRSSGINLIKIASPLILMGLILSLFCIILNNKLIPYTHFASRRLLSDIGSKNPAAALEAGTFINSFQNNILFIYRIDGNKLENIRIYQPQGEGKPTRTIVAKKGEFISYPNEGKIKLKLIDGTSDEPDFKNPNNFFKLNFRNYFLTLDLLKNNTIDKKPKDMTIKELAYEINKYKTLNIETAVFFTEMHKKISTAFSCFIFILFGMPLAIITHSRQKAINFSIIFMVVVAYYLLSIGFEALSIQNVILPAGAMWATNIIMGGAGLILTFRLCEY
ncbi:MAG: LptF/LptG family permease [Candidatus Omnitrophota bacterium]|nr:LptF/LptG family permease [Candidatus Omnitrophota bacterium]